jgi:GNAT superfamily N-acetyltransferase
MPDRPLTPSFASAVGRGRGRGKEWTLSAFDARRKPIGTAGSASYRDDEDNPVIAWASITVERGHRRCGVATALLTSIVEHAQREGRTRIVGTAMDDDGGPAFAEAIGAVPKQAWHVWDLSLADVDMALMDKRIADAAVRAPGYDLLKWDGAVPEEHAEAFVHLALAMNDAPRDQLAVNDWRWSVADMRESERRLAEQKTEVWILVARRLSDGDLAGFHQAMWNPADPTTVWIASTAVAPEHRERGIQKWMGAVQTLRIMAERPDVTSQRVTTADSNEVIVATMREKGYRPVAGYKAWEVSVADAAAWLNARGRKLPLRRT